MYLSEDTIIAGFKRLKQKQSKGKKGLVRTLWVKES